MAPHRPVSFVNYIEELVGVTGRASELCVIHLGSEEIAPELEQVAIQELVCVCLEYV